MDTQKYLIDLLARGMSPTNAAEVAGCSVGYVSQLCTQEDFSNELAQLRAKYAAERDQRQEKVQQIHDQYLDMEKMVLKQIKDAVPFMRPGEKIKLLQVLGSKKEPPPTIDPMKNSGLAPVVTINMPNVIAAQFVLNQQREIVGMNDGKTFAPMSTKLLNREAIAQDAKDGRALPIPQLQTSEEILGLFNMAPTDVAIQL